MPNSESLIVAAGSHFIGMAPENGYGILRCAAAIFLDLGKVVEELLDSFEMLSPVSRELFFADHAPSAGGPLIYREYCLTRPSDYQELCTFWT